MTTCTSGGHAAAAAGLVPSINKSVNDWILIDKLKARCTRLRKNLGVSAKWLSQTGRTAWMLTLTYRDDVAWEPKHVSEAIHRLRKWMDRKFGQRLHYIWVMETKARKSGANIGLVREHYHVVVWVPFGVRASDLKLDARGFWPHGMTQAVQARAAVRYVMKYASKFDNEGAFPRGARCYGVGGLDDVGRRVRRWINWPTFVQARASISDNWGRCVGGGWVNRDTGEWLPSEWGLSGVGRWYTRLVRICEHERPMPAGGPFSWFGGGRSAGSPGLHVVPAA
jgi:hypothetical protein